MDNYPFRTKEGKEELEAMVTTMLADVIARHISNQVIESMKARV